MSGDQAQDAPNDHNIMVNHQPAPHANNMQSGELRTSVSPNATNTVLDSTIENRTKSTNTTVLIGQQENAPADQDRATRPAGPEKDTSIPEIVDIADDDQDENEIDSANDLFVGQHELRMDVEYAGDDVQLSTILEHFREADEVKDELADDAATVTEPTATPVKKKRGRQKGAGTGTKKRKAAQLSNNNLGNVFGTNVLDDVDASAHLPNLPNIETDGTRAEALRALRDGLRANGLESTSEELQRIESAMQAFDGKQRVKLVDSFFEVKGVKTSLHAYQMIGAGFMRTVEKSTGPNDPKGGILADTMGLGKTLMMLTNIVNGIPTAVRARRPTLIVASPVLLKQWSDEIHKHVEVDERLRWGVRKFNFFKYIAAGKPRNLERLLEQHDIVLATYSAVSTSYPAGQPPLSYSTAEQKRRWFEQHFSAKRGPLHRVHWHRVVLDEAHAIKNFASKTSLACRSLKADHHWAITGTPVHNSLKEFYPYLSFIRDPCVTSKAQFEASFLDPDDESPGVKLTTLLNRVMIRRTHASTMFGARLLDLPRPIPPNDMILEFDVFEQKVYDIVRERFVQRMNQIAKAGNANKHRHIFAMFLRLRQLTGHVLLIQGPLEDLLDLNDVNMLLALCKQHTKETTDQETLMTQLQLQRLLQEAKLVKQASGSQKLRQGDAPFIDLTGMSDEQMDSVGIHGQYSLRPEGLIDAMTQSVKMHEISARTKCNYCKQPPADPYATSCSHVYCRVCVENLQVRAARAGRDGATCKKCHTVFTSVEPIRQRLPDAISPDDDETKKKRKQKTTTLSWIDSPGPVPPSSKTKAMRQQIASWMADDAAIKVIVYTQFRDMIRILARVCQTEGWSFVKYHGGMTPEARSNSLEKFAHPTGGVSILLASLKCGGQGLNLTAAARVLIMDSWWNVSVEDQAFCRVYRIGQEKPTQLTRLRVQDTIDEYMFEMKDRKQGEIDPIVENLGSASMTIEDMMRALGPVSYDEHGRPYIITDGPVDHASELFRMTNE